MGNEAVSAATAGGGSGSADPSGAAGGDNPGGDGGNGGGDGGNAGGGGNPDGSAASDGSAATSGAGSADPGGSEAAKQDAAEGADKEKGKDGEQPVELSDDEYGKLVTLGDGEQFKGFALDPTVIAAITPVAKKAGIKPEVMSELAQALCAQHIAATKAASDAERAEFQNWFTEKKKAAIEALGETGIAHVRKAVDKYAKPGSFFRAMIDNGLGNDVEFLAMCRDIGMTLVSDNAAGAGSGDQAGAGRKSWKENWAASSGLK